MKTEIGKQIWKFSGDSNIYFLDFDKKILIDCGNAVDKEFYKEEIAKVIPLEKIDKVLLTHLHYDHIGCYDLFPNAKFFASKESIKCFEKMPFRTILNPKLSKDFKEVELHEVKNMHGLKVIDCPGHTKGSVAYWYEKEKILFSGDTLFDRGMIGRCDLPTSIREKIDSSLKKLRELDYEILCPGHDY